MIDHQLLAPSIMPAQRTVQMQLRLTVAPYLRRVGVSFEEVPNGLLINARETEHLLELRCGPRAIDDPIEQLRNWAC